jgi:uncharacterized protein HemX
MSKSIIEVQAEFDASLKSAISVVKKYIDEQDKITQEGLADEVVARLSGDDGLVGQIERVQGLASAFVSVFDTDKDGAITKEEILLKLSANNETVESLITRLSGAEDKIKQIETDITSTKVVLGGQSQKISELNLSVEQIKSNFLAKDDIPAVFANVVSVVTEVLYPSEDSNAL